MKRLLAYLFLVLVFVNSNFSYVVAQEIKEKIPEWFINMPKSTEDIIYERGTALLIMYAFEPSSFACGTSTVAGWPSFSNILG